MNRSALRLSAAAVALACVAAAVPARAQMMHVPGTDWRRPDRHDAITAAAKPPMFYFEVRFGTYQPGIDSDPAFASKDAANRPYASIFGTTPLFYFGLEFDAVPIRIPYVGAFGLGAGWGFTRTSAIANFSQSSTDPNKTGGPSAETTALTIMPMHVSFVLRGDELMRRTGVPFVPYGKAGVGISYWRVSNDAGTEAFRPCERNTPSTVVPASCSSATNPPGNVNGNGLTPSLHFALGGMLALNWLEPQASARLDETTGVHHAYLFGEYYNDRITIGSNVMRVGTSSWAAGLAADF